MRLGIVLIELLLVIAILGILAAIAAPRVTALNDAAAVRAEAMEIVAALDAARGASIRLGTVTTLTLADSAYRVVAVVGSDTVTAWRHSGPVARGVTLSTPARGILFGPAGLAVGAANRTITLTRGTTSRQVVISRLGRLTY
jgi:Tfp pilus assembly protein FimT